MSKEVLGVSVNGGERVSLVCQYCYSTVLFGRPHFFDDKGGGDSNRSSFSPNSGGGSPSKSSRSNLASNMKSFSSQHSIKSVPQFGKKDKNSVVDEFSQRSAEEAFEAFQKVLIELEKENEMKANPRMRVTSVNPFTMVPLQSFSEFDESNSSVNTSDDQLEMKLDSYSSPNSSESAVNQVVEHEQMGTERTPAQRDNSLLPYSKETVDAFFDSLSECSALDFPICCSCANTLIDSLDTKAQLLTRECRSLMEQKLEAEQKLSQVCSETDLDEIISQLESEEQSLMKELEQLECEKLSLEETNLTLNMEEKKMMKQESALSIENNELQQQIYELETTLSSVTEQLKFSEDHFNALKKTNVFNLVFNIWHHENKFGTINGFRLGKLNDTSSTNRVEWTEINMALGQACLLLHCLIAKLNFQPNCYTLVPCGSRSYIESAVPNNDGSVAREKLRLYSEGGNKFSFDSSIDAAMKAFLNVLDQFRSHLEQKNSEFRLPYPMRGEMIYEKQGSDIGFSVCPGKASPEIWTKACRMILTNLKWGIVGVSTLTPHPSDWLQAQSGSNESSHLHPSSATDRGRSITSGPQVRQGSASTDHNSRSRKM